MISLWEHQILSHKYNDLVKVVTWKILTYMTKMVAATFTVMYPPQKNIYGGSVVVYDGRLITELLVV